MRAATGKERPSPQRRLTTLGLSVLALGVLSYPLFREGPSLLVPGAHALFNAPSPLLGSFPTFAHVFGFSALLMAIFWPSRRMAFASVLSWLATSVLLELLQLRAISIDVLARGTFDVLDLFAIGAAGVLIETIGLLFRRKELRSPPAVAQETIHDHA